MEELVDSPAEREQVRETGRLAVDVATPGVFCRVVRGYDRVDTADSLLGALLFGIPMFVEGGTNEVGAFVATHPPYLLATHLMTIGPVVGLIYVAGIQDVCVYRPFFGIVPRRLVGVLSVSFGTALLMTVGGVSPGPTRGLHSRLSASRSSRWPSVGHSGISCRGANRAPHLTTVKSGRAI